MGDWTAHARQALREGPAALVTILAVEGSAPRGPGALVARPCDILAKPRSSCRPSRARGRSSAGNCSRAGGGVLAARASSHRISHSAS